MRRFNTTGPVRSQEHYCLPPLERFELREIAELIELQKYFILHAPRQVGKTSYLLALTDYLNQQGDLSCVYVNVEAAQAARENVAGAMQVILGQIALRALNFIDDPFPMAQWQPTLAQFGPFAALNVLLTQWAQESTKPLVLLIDEIDTLIGDTLISVLRQLRSGYDQRPKLFPQSVILCGVRDIRDYRIHSTIEKAIITGGSAFNIKAESLRMDSFTQDEVTLLYQQHTDETGQPFEENAVAALWQLTQGQPWLVNALAHEACFKISPAQSIAYPITQAMVMRAKEQIIRRRETHLDQLADKLQEERVRQIISPMLQGIQLGESVRDDDLQYVIDLGLVHRGAHGPTISNPIYQEIIPRQLTNIAQANLEGMIEPTWYIQADGRLDVEKLLVEFQQFFRENSEAWSGRFQYQEAGPQLMMQAYLQRVVNGGGRIIREYGLGRRRTDLLIIWPLPEQDADKSKVQRVVIELKIRYGKLEETIKAGLEQTWHYMDRSAANQGHLVIFDRAKKKSWKEKIFKRKRQFQGQKITVWGM